MMDSVVLQNAPIGIFVVDRDDTFTTFNKSMELISGLSVDEILGKNLLKDIPEHTLGGEADFRRMFLDAKNSLLESSRDMMPIITPGGYLSYQTISMVPLIDDNDNYDGMAVYVKEVSEEYIQEERLLDELQHAREIDSIYVDIPVIFFRWSAKDGWPVEFVSDNISQLGYGKEEFLSGSLKYADIVHPDDLKKLKMHTEQLESGKHSYLFDEYRLLNKDGNAVWVNEISMLKLDDSGLPSYYDGMIIDITGRVQAERSLLREREYLNDITSSLEVGLCIISPEFRTVWANDYQKKIFGDVEGKLCYQAYNHKTSVCENCAVQKILETNKDKVVTDQDSFDVNGNRVWSHLIAIPVRDDEGNVVSVMELVYPVTEMKRVEMELRESKARLESVFKAAPVGMGVLSNRVFEEVNDRLCDMLGYSKEELLGQSIRMIYPSDEVFEYIGKVHYSQMVECGSGEMETQIVTKDGRKIDVFLSSNPIHSDFISRGITFTMLDISNLKEAERELKEHTLELERLNDLKDLFSDIIRHDLLSPAGLVKGYAEILEEMENDESKLHILHVLQENNNRLIELIENASKYEQLNSLEEIDFHKADIVSIFRSVTNDMSPIIRDKGMDVILPSKGPCHSCVNTLISEVFLNLLSNAIKYSPENESIDIDFLDAGKFWKVAVTDNGEGISDTNKEFIFERFKRADKMGVKGTGLGLAIVKRIMELHDGEYGVEDNPSGKGSVFWVKLKKAGEGPCQ